MFDFTRFMTPAMQKMFYTQMMANQGQGNEAQQTPQLQPLTPPTNTLSLNPTGKGAAAAIEAARTSMALSPGQQKKALGRGLVQFAASRPTPQPGTGFRGALASIAEAMPHAVNAYQNEMDRQELLNLELMKMEQQQEKGQMEKLFALMQRQDQMEETKRHHQMMEKLTEGRQTEMNRHHLATEEYQGYNVAQRKKYEELEKKLPPGVEYLDKYPLNSNTRMFWEKTIKKQIEEGDEANRALTYWDELDKIFQRNPGFHKSMNYILLHGQDGEDPSYWQQKAIELNVPEKQWADFVAAGKISARLWASEARSIPAKGLSVYGEKQLSAGNPKLGIPYAAFKKLRKLSQKELMHKEDTGLKTSQYAQQGMIYREPAMAQKYPSHILEKAIEEDAAQQKAQAVAAQQMQVKQQDDAALQKAIAEGQARGIPPELILQAKEALDNGL